MSTPNEPKYYQHLELHMKNGEVVHVYEDYDIPVEDGIVGDFKKKKKKHIEWGDLFVGYVIPLDQISFMRICSDTHCQKAAEMLPIHDTGLCSIYTITKGR